MPLRPALPLVSSSAIFLRPIHAAFAVTQRATSNQVDLEATSESWYAIRKTASASSNAASMGRRAQTSHSSSKTIYILNPERFCSSNGERGNKFREMSASGGDFITGDSGLLKMPVELVLSSSAIMDDGAECRNTNWKLWRVVRSNLYGLKWSIAVFLFTICGWQSDLN